MTQKPEDAAAALLAAGRAGEALALVEPLGRSPGASHTLLARWAVALKMLERADEALAVRRLAAERFPQSGVAWHNLASALCDLGADNEAAEAARKAFQLGLDAPETWLVYGRALAGQQRLEAAVEGLDEALRRRPGYPEALEEKAKQLWAMTRDADRAAAVFPAGPAHAQARAAMFRAAGDPSRGLAELEEALRAAPGDLALMQAVAALALEAGAVVRALEASDVALARAPNDPISMQARAAACLAAGRPEEALALARRLVASQPHNGSVVALAAVAARLAGAPEAERLFDYPTMVRGFDIGPPPGWSTAAAWLADLKTSLDRLHDGAVEPAAQSLRGGTQTGPDLRIVDDPAIRSFFIAIDPAIRAYMAGLGAGDDPLRARNSGGYAISGAWSIRLRSAGRHVDHIHPRGWLSSAFYVEVPPEVAADDEARAGWLQFGRPSLRTEPPLEPAWFERPSPGRLVLFPSYMWHGTAPFVSARPRTTIAFDVVPA
ncbi:MAG: hypothetical protein BGN86_09335 [Caulobacterales bacterium 68-7]|nr:MAG: hypothetical protein BGN86_09335 [Caulobacterales bacterium 68-7]